MMSSLLGSIAVLASAAGSGQIEGRILSPEGSPLVGASVSLRRVPKVTRSPGRGWSLADGEVRFDTTVKTGSDGRFRAGGVPEGPYYVCPYVTGSNLLPFCEWSYAPQAQVTAGRTVTVADLRLERGTLLRVVVDDAQSLAQVPRGPRGNANLIIGVRKGESFHALRAVPDTQPITYITPVNAKGEPLERVPAPGQARRPITRHTLEAYVPINTDLRLWVHGPALQVRDQASAPVNTAGLGQTLRFSQSAQAFTINLNVTGRAQ